MMVHETTCGLSFQLTKGGIDDVIEDGCQTKSFNNKYAKWATAVCRWQTLAELWFNDLQLNHTHDTSRCCWTPKSVKIWLVVIQKPLDTWYQLVSTYPKPHIQRALQ
jgi:hypothetical protein